MNKFRYLVLFCSLVLTLPVYASERSIVSHSSPIYPEVAKRLKISGTVKVEATVDADGKVISVKTVGGNKMLAPAAEDAVKKWKFETGSGISTTNVEVNFSLGN